MKADLLSLGEIFQINIKGKRSYKSLRKIQISHESHNFMSPYFEIS